MFRLIRIVINKINDFFFCFIMLFVKRSYVITPLQIDGKKNITIGRNVTVSSKSWLAAMQLTGNKAELIIEDGACIGHFAHIYATKSIHIGKKVLIADKVYISDNLHGYEDVNMPIMEQEIVQKNPVSIGDNSWIGENVCIIGASIGKHCVIGANAVVTKNIPDYCVAVGNPAKIIKKYNFDKNKWERV